MTETIANNAKSTLVSNITSNQLTFNINDPDLFPSDGNFRVIVDSEIMLVTNVSDSLFTVSREVENTNAAAHSADATVTHVLTAQSLVNVITQSAIFFSVAAVDATDKEIAGADYTCSGENDATEINQALTAIAAGNGGEVRLSSGNFVIDDAIRMPSETTLRGVGWQTKLNYIDHLDPIESHPVIANLDWAGTDTNIAVRDLYIDGNKGDGSTSGQWDWDTVTFPDTDSIGNRGCVHFTGVIGLVIDNVRVDDGYGAALEIEHVSECTISNNRTDRSADDGIGVNIECFNIVVTHNEISRTGDGYKYGYPNGIEVQDDVHNIMISHNVIRDSIDGTNVGPAILIHKHAAENPVYDIVVIGNMIINVKSGITIQDDSYNVSVMGNTVKLYPDDIGGSSNACLLLVDCKHISVVGNILDMNGRGAAINTVATSVAEDILIQGNQCVGGGSRSALFFYNEVSRWQIIGNIFDTTYAGINIHNAVTMTDIVIQNNTFQNMTSGIFIRLEGGAVFSGCVISGCVFESVTYPIRPYDNADIVLPVGWQAFDNIGAQTYHVKKSVQCKNTSGGTLVAGDVVVMKISGVKNETEVTTTDTGGDGSVYGVATETITDNSIGEIQIEGRCAVIQVSGQSDISVNSRLSTYNVAKVAKIAGAGETVFAVAAEGYATDDPTYGTIIAYLITPRMV